MKTTASQKLAKQLKIQPARAMEAVMKAQLIAAILRASEKKELTHAELAKRSGIPRSSVTGILSGSMQKVTLDRVLRLADAAELTAEIKIRNAA